MPPVGANVAEPSDVLEQFALIILLRFAAIESGWLKVTVSVSTPVSYTHLTLPTICSV